MRSFITVGLLMVILVVAGFATGTFNSRSSMIDLTDVADYNFEALTCYERGIARQEKGDLSAARADLVRAIELNLRHSGCPEGDLSGGITDLDKVIEEFLTIEGCEVHPSAKVATRAVIVFFLIVSSPVWFWFAIAKSAKMIQGEFRLSATMERWIPVLINLLCVFLAIYLLVWMFTRNKDASTYLSITR